MGNTRVERADLDLLEQEIDKILALRVYELVK